MHNAEPAISKGRGRGDGGQGVCGARAQAAWPSRPVRYINPYPAGGPTDTLSRKGRFGRY
jgi:hypothetical protein